MLKCRDIVHQASDYVDGHMTLRQRLAVGIHLLLCGKCRAFIRHLRTSLAYYRQLQNKELDAAEVRAIVERVVGNSPGPAP
jgi:hypothetical protein